MSAWGRPKEPCVSPNSPLPALARTGRRVSVRRVVGQVDGRPLLSDVLGLLERSDADTVVVRRADGSAVSVVRASIVAARLVPPPSVSAAGRAGARRALATSAPELERIAALGWLGLENGRVGEWLLRAAGGFTGRANSALPVGDPGLPLADAVDAVVAWYAARGLPPRFQVPLPCADEVDAELAARGWAGGDGALVLVADLEPLLARPAVTAVGATVQVDRVPDDAWLGAYHYRGGSLPAHARAVVERGDNLGFASARAPDGSVLAIARGSLDEGWLGVTAVEVEPGARRRGLAGIVLRELAQWAADQGGQCCYLQVSPANAPALALYRAAGFVDHHWYQDRTP
jgi:ribosomal protein S18 acetylase RimI-like enzyme